MDAALCQRVWRGERAGVAAGTSSFFRATVPALDSFSLKQLDFNRGVVIRSFTYFSIRPHVERLGLQLETAYSCLLNYLLRPKPAVQAFIAQYTSLFSLPEYFVVGLQVRTGDLAMVRIGFSSLPRRN